MEKFLPDHLHKLVRGHGEAARLTSFGSVLQFSFLEQVVLNRTKTLYQGQEICNHFNKERGCFRINCKYAHLCLTCKKEHSQSRCPLAKNGKTGQIPHSGPKK